MPSSPQAFSSGGGDRRKNQQQQQRGGRGSKRTTPQASPVGARATTSAGGGSEWTVRAEDHGGVESPLGLSAIPMPAESADARPRSRGGANPQSPGLPQASGATNSSFRTSAPSASSRNASRNAMTAPESPGLAASPLGEDHKPIIAERFKTRMCKNWKETGACPYEVRCMFAHGDADFRSKEQNMADGLVTEEAVKLWQRARAANDRRGATSGGGGGGRGGKTRGGRKAKGGGESTTPAGSPTIHGASLEGSSAFSPGRLESPLTGGGTTANSGGRGLPSRDSSVPDLGAAAMGSGSARTSAFEALSAVGIPVRRAPAGTSESRGQQSADSQASPTHGPLSWSTAGRDATGDSLRLSFASAKSAPTPPSRPASLQATDPGASSTGGSAFKFQMLDGVANFGGSSTGVTGPTTMATGTGPTTATGGGSSAATTAAPTDERSTASNRSDSQERSHFGASAPGAAGSGTHVAAAPWYPRGSGLPDEPSGASGVPSSFVLQSAGDAEGGSGSGGADVDRDLHELISAVLQGHT